MALKLCRNKVTHHQEPKERCNLSQLVKQYSDTRCADARDKIFALRALHRCDLPRHPEVLTDYSMSVVELLLLARAHVTRSHSLTGIGAFVDACRLLRAMDQVRSGSDIQQFAPEYRRWDAERRRLFWLELTCSSRFDVYTLRFTLAPLAEWEEVGSLLWDASPIGRHFSSEVKGASIDKASSRSPAVSASSTIHATGVNNLRWPKHSSDSVGSKHCTCIVPRMNDVVCMTPQLGRSIDEDLLYLVLRAGPEPGGFSIVRAVVESPSLEAQIREARMTVDVAEPLAWDIKIDVIDFLTVCYAVLCERDSQQRRRNSEAAKARL